MVLAGGMRHVVRIERPAAGQDAAGQPVDGWDLVVIRRAAIVATTGREVFASAQRQARIPTLFSLRFVADVLPGMRLVHQVGSSEKVFNILSVVDPDGRRVETLLTTEELVEATP